MKNAMIGGLTALFATGYILAHSASAQPLTPLANHAPGAITLIGWGDNGQGGGYGGTPQNQSGGSQGGYGGGQPQNQGGGYGGNNNGGNQGGTYNNNNNSNQGGTYNNDNQGTYNNDNYPKKKKRKNQGPLRRCLSGSGRPERLRRQQQSRRRDARRWPVGRKCRRQLGGKWQRRWKLWRKLRRRWLCRRRW